MIKQQMLLASIHLPLIISFNCGENRIMLIKEYDSTISLVQCCPTFLTPRAAEDIIMKSRAAPVNSKVGLTTEFF